MAYPYRPTRKAKPLSSEHINGRRKTWLSLRNITDGRMDMSPRLSAPWWKAPIYVAARTAKLASLRASRPQSER